MHQGTRSKNKVSTFTGITVNQEDSGAGRSVGKQS
jgi:hypothetical protein